jgi:hypothetical protein
MITILLLIAIALIVWCFILCLNRQPKYFVAKIGEYWYICYEDLTQIDEVYRVAKFDNVEDALRELKNYER